MPEHEPVTDKPSKSQRMIDFARFLLQGEGSVQQPETPVEQPEP